MFFLKKLVVTIHVVTVISCTTPNSKPISEVPSSDSVHKASSTIIEPYGDVIVRVVNPSKISVYWKDQLGSPIKTFANLFSLYTNLSYAMNAGMYAATPDNRPLGLYIEDGKKLFPIKQSFSKTQNFGMQPQGVFFITKDNIAKVVSVDEYQKLDEKQTRCATQSAPMLVINGQINPKLTNSTSATNRNGVGVSQSGQVVLIYAKRPVTFQEFAQLFIDNNCTKAQYLDGTISNLLDRNMAAFDVCECYGPFIGVSF